MPYLKNSIACKMMISPEDFFIFLFEIFIFEAVRRVKGQKIAQNDKLCPLHFISQEPYII